MAYVAVVGPGDAPPADAESAELIGRGIALALKAGIPVIGLKTWEIEEIEVVNSPEHALRAIQRRT